MSEPFLVIAALAVAAANGANDNFKGVATLFGSRTASYRASLAWATVTTFAGSLTAMFLGSRLASAFSGQGLLPSHAVADPTLLSAVAVGAALTVGIAARAGLPISTTHAILGALLGAGAMAAAGELRYGVLMQRFVAPLLLSPIVGCGLVATIYPVASRLRRRLGVEATSCLCMDPVADTIPAIGGALFVVRREPRLRACDRRYAGALLGLDAQQVVTAAHALSAGLQSFARGLNDTPKIAALLLGARLAGASAPASLSFAGVAVAMMAGGWFGARRVGETMSERITSLNEGQALTASSVTASLVLAASLLALPVSMTHVAVGSLAGLGWTIGEARWGMLRTIALSWILTLPLAASLGAAAYAVAERMIR